MIGVVAALALGASAFLPQSALLRPRQRPMAITLRALPAEVEKANSWDRGTYPDADVEELWDALCEVYESEAAAAKAAIQVRGSVLCPIYSSPSMLRDSKAALENVLGADEAAVIMEKNPAVLTVGSDLVSAEPDEIRRLASLREQLDKIPPSALLAVVLGLSAFIGGKILLIQTGVLDFMG